MGKKPNIVIFMTDHQRRETMPGYDWCITPALDAFARDAVTFTNAVCTSPHCCPSQARSSRGCILRSTGCGTMWRWGTPSPGAFRRA